MVKEQEYRGFIIETVNHPSLSEYYEVYDLAGNNLMTFWNSSEAFEYIRKQKTENEKHNHSYMERRKD
jgi:hypothetical protein